MSSWYFLLCLSLARLIAHHDTSDASLATASSVGLKSRALLSRPSSSAILSAPYRSPYFLITYKKPQANILSLGFQV